MSYATLQDALIHGTGVERSFLCEQHEDHNASASVNSLTGFWLCYACGARGKVDISTLEVDYFAVGRFVGRAVAQLEKAHPTYPEGWLDLYDSAGPGSYWLDRFDRQTCRSFRLGQDDDGNPLYPLRDNAGRVLGVVRRRLVDEGPKYRYPSGINVTDYLFGYHRLNSGVVLLVEGATDAIAVYEATGRDMALATYGDRLSAAQVAALQRWSPDLVVLAQDMDLAGHEAAWDAAERLRRAGIYNITRPLWEDYKDLAEMPVELRKEVLARSGWTR